MKYKNKHFKSKIAIIGLFVMIAWLIAGCSNFSQQQLSCNPIKAEGCIGFLTDKPIYLNEEVIL